MRLQRNKDGADPSPPEAYHVPVLLQSVLHFLQPRPGGVYVDGTLGAGGHTEAILRQSAPSGRVIGIDRDPEALSIARARLAEFGNRLHLVHATFDQMEEILRALGCTNVDGVLLDLGVCSYQLDRPERGFSFRYDGPLDMRMDPTQGLTAAEVVNSLPEHALVKVLREWGEERYAGRIAKAIVRKRAKTPIQTTRQLAEVVAEAVPPSYRYGRIHPATRTFQALRILVNQELTLLEKGLCTAVRALAPGGRIAVISYHSLEDRLTKRVFRGFSGQGAELQGCPAILRVLTRRPVVPDEAEVAQNPRARSAKLRAGEKQDAKVTE